MERATGFAATGIALKWHPEKVARAVIEAIREVDNDAMQAGYDAEATANPYKTQSHHVVPAIWEAMIDELLSGAE